jgi:hypothetical protein
VRLNIPAAEIVNNNPNAIYMETWQGNHFGFVQGSIYQHCVTRDHQSYTFPAKVCEVFFSSLLDPGGDE